MEIKEHLTLKNILFVVLVFIGLAFIAQIKQVALLFFGSYVIACSLNPIVNRISEKIPRIWATSFIIVVVLALLLAVFCPILSITFKEFISIIHDLPNRISEVSAFLSQFKIMGHSALEFINMDNITNAVNDIGKTLINRSVDFTMGFLTFVAVLFSIIMIVFYLIYEQKEIKKDFLRLFPPKIRPKAEYLTNTISERVGGYVIAQIASMSVVGIITAIGLMILNVKYAVFLGLLAGITDIIPIVGPTLALCSGIVVAIPDGILIVTLTAFVFMLAQWVSNNWTRPLVFGKFLNLHPLIIILSFLVAAQFLGVWGVILAPAIAAVIVTLFDEIYVKQINKEKDD